MAAVHKEKRRRSRLRPYPFPMPISHVSPGPRCLLVLASLMPGLAAALELKAVEVRGLDEEMAANVRDHLSLEQLDPARRATLSEGRLSFYLRNAPREVRAGLEPYGYYDAEVAPEVVRNGDVVTVVLAVTLGEPVRVRGHQVSVAGPAASDPVIATLVGGFRPAKGAIFHHGTYETSKAGINRALGERGYFDAILAAHRVEVTRADHAADMTLAWTAGNRYLFGPAVFEGSQFEPELLEKVVPWREGEPFDQAKLLRLQESLSDLDYFNGIQMTPQTDQASDGKVPVKVSLVPAKRSIYGAGVSYGTDSGAGVSGHIERRWMNRRGHKALADANLAEKLSDVIVQYKVPGFALVDGWYTAGARLHQEMIEEVDSELVELSLTRSGRWRKWNLLAGLYLQRERYDSVGFGYVEDTAYSTLLYPSLWAQYKNGDDANYPRRGHGMTFEVRGGSDSLGSDVDFLSLRAEGRYVRGLGPDNRLILRSELGALLVDDYLSLPPSQRFFAGGDRSVRGYGYKEIGERPGVTIIDDDGDVIDPVYGGKYLAVASVEFEHMVTREWGGAVFVDAGDAWDTEFKPEVGIGIGLRWRSPVGPIRLDIAHGLENPDNIVRFHLIIGSEL